MSAEPTAFFALGHLWLHHTLRDKMSQKNAKRKRKEHTVLAGHRQDKKNIFTCLPPNTEPVSYTEHGVPELVWIAIMVEELGEHRTARIIQIIAEAIRTEPPDMAPPPLLATFVASLPQDRRDVAIRTLDASGLLQPMKSALAAFVALYPNFPIAWLTGEPLDKPDTAYLQRFKILLAELLDKQSPRSSIVLALLIYAALGSGAILVPPGEFDNLETIREYPNTERSKWLAASLRSLATMLIALGLQRSTTRQWAEYFWQRGHELEPVDYTDLVEE